LEDDNVIRALFSNGQVNLTRRLTQGSPRLTQAHAAQGGVTLGPEQGELGANFCYLGHLGPYYAR